MVDAGARRFRSSGAKRYSVSTKILLVSAIILLVMNTISQRYNGIVSAIISGAGHPGGNPAANLKSISHRCHPILVAFVWELTEETINLPLGCLQGRYCMSDARVQEVEELRRRALRLRPQRLYAFRELSYY